MQCSFLHADTDVQEDKESLRETLQKPDIDDDTKDPSATVSNWFDMLALPNSNNMFPSSSVSMMAQITNSNKTLEEQLNDIKELAKQISDLLESEMINLFSDVVTNKEREVEENGVRKRRSAETPMDSTKMVMRLLKHIKSNNEYQNIAIDKMMSAQEIAEKFGIEFNPDPEILSDLAVAANEHAQEMTNMLKNACSLKNITVEKVDFVPIVNEPKETKHYYTYASDNNEPSFEYLPDIMSKPKPNHVHSDSISYFNYPYESQASSLPAHHHHSAPVTPKPSFYDPFTYPYSPVSDYYGTYTMEPAMLIPIEEPELEPELVGEVVEETITSKMIVEKGDEPGSTTVNHVTSYTISEKSHFKPPQIEKLPQHFQYCFLLM